MARIVFIQGSARNPTECSGQWGKTRLFVQRGMATAEALGMETDLIDLSVTDGVPLVKPCKACISTAGGYHCHYPCDCYPRGDDDGPDFLAENYVYERIGLADALIVYAPINWYAVPTQVKAMFDRLVCVNLTLTRKHALDVLGDGNLKNPTVTRAAEKAAIADDLLQNHWEGKTAAFFVHGDDGADDYLNRPKPRSLRLYPDSTSPVNDPRMAVLPLVQQMRYSGINVPEDLVVGYHFNEGLNYATANDRIKRDSEALDAASQIVRRLVARIHGGY